MSGRRWSRGARAAAAVDRLSQNLDEYAERGKRTPEFRERVRALAESQWGEPFVVLHLGDVEPVYTVPGRRKDGTVKGKRLVRRFFWNIVRGVGNVVVNAVTIFGGAVGDVFAGKGTVTGPANAQALGLVDAARSAKSAWLVHSPTHVAVIDSHHSTPYTAPADCPPPTVVWHAAKPHAPQVSARRQHITWPDGSEFRYDTGDRDPHRPR